MLTSKLSEHDRDKPSRRHTGHGTASVIARLNEQNSQIEPSTLDSALGPAQEEANPDDTLSGPVAEGQSHREEDPPAA